MPFQAGDTTYKSVAGASFFAQAAMFNKSCKHNAFERQRLKRETLSLVKGAEMDEPIYQQYENNVDL